MNHPVGKNVKAEKYQVGDRVRCYREAPDGATGVIVAVKIGTSSPYKIEWDRKHPYSRSDNQTWVSRVVVMGRERP